MHVSLPSPDLAPPAGPAPAWVDRLGPALDGHVLIIGDGTLDLICALIRRGCPGASALHFEDRVLAENVETVLVPHVCNRFEAERAIAMAVRALTPAGRIILRLAPALAGEVERMLRSRGFSALRAETGEAGEATMLLSGVLPIFGAHAWAMEQVTHA